MEYKICSAGLFDRLKIWNSFLRRKVHLIACGGTALTLLGIKTSTKDIDFMVPVEKEYKYLIRILKDIGYKQVTGAGWSSRDIFIFDLFSGNKIHTTELIESALDVENHIFLKEFSHIYLGVLNYYDLIISKLFRGTEIDMTDCLSLLKAKESDIDLEILNKRFAETASYDISEGRVMENLKTFMEKAMGGIW